MHEKAFCYNVKPFKSQLIIQKNCKESAKKEFDGTNFTLVDGFRGLGLVL